MILPNRQKKNISPRKIVVKLGRKMKTKKYYLTLLTIPITKPLAVKTERKKTFVIKRKDIGKTIRIVYNITFLLRHVLVYLTFHRMQNLAVNSVVTVYGMS